MRTNGGARASEPRRGMRAWGMRVAVPLLMVVPALLAACGPAAGAVTQANDQTFTWPLQAEAKLHDEVFDPAQIQTAYDMGSAQMVYSGLVALGSDLTVQSDAAKSWDISQGGLTYTFHLIPNMHFSDGQPLRAQDFAYSLNRVLDPCTAAYGAYYLYELAHSVTFNSETCTQAATKSAPEVLSPAADQTAPLIKTLIGDSIQTPDDQTLVLKLSAPAAYFLEALTYSTAYPVEKTLVDAYPSDWQYHLDKGGCSGPFMVGSYGDGTVITYVPNPAWEQTHKKLTIQKVVRPFVENVDTMYDLYRGGKFDYTDVPLRSYGYARLQSDFHEVAGLEIQYFGLNFLTPPFDNQAVRQAFDLALNKQDLIHPYCEGVCIPTNHIVPQGMPGFDPNLTNPPPDGTLAITGNQQAALQLLGQAQAQCHGVPPDATPTPGFGVPAPTPDPAYCPYIDAKHYTPLKEIDIYTSTSNPTRVALMQAAAVQWNSYLGLNVQPKTTSTFGQIVKGIDAGQYSAWAIGWLADYPDPQDFLSLQFMSNATTSNLSHVNSHDLDQLMIKADSDPNPTTRMEEYHQVEQTVVNLVPWIPYAQENITWRLRPWVHGFALNSMGSFPDTAWLGVYILSH